jgi:hypothetical protein
VRSVELSSKEGLSASAGCVGVLDSYAEGRAWRQLAVSAVCREVGRDERHSDGILDVSEPVGGVQTDISIMPWDLPYSSTSEYKKH